LEIIYSIKLNFYTCLLHILDVLNRKFVKNDNHLCWISFSEMNNTEISWSNDNIGKSSKYVFGLFFRLTNICVY